MKLNFLLQSHEKIITSVNVVISLRVQVKFVQVKFAQIDMRLINFCQNLCDIRAFLQRSPTLVMLLTGI